MRMGREVPAGDGNNCGRRFLFLCILAVSILWLSACQPQPTQTVPVAKQGRLDLGRWEFGQHHPIPLQGEWEFYWQQLLTPDDFVRSTPEDKSYIQVPSSWNHHQINGESGASVGGDGFATYRLHVHLSETEDPQQQYALKLLNMGSAYKLWIDNWPTVSVGRVATHRAEMQPGYKPQIVTFSSSSRYVTLTIQVSNFHHRKGGMWNSIQLGIEQQVREERRKRDLFDLFILGALLIMAFYHFGLFSLRRSDPSTLYFGLFCLIIGLRSLFYREVSILMLLPDISWESINRIRYLSTYSAMPVFMMFVHSLYPDEFSKKLLRLLQIVSAIFMGIVLFSTVKTYSFTMLPYQIITLLVCSYVGYVLYHAAKNQREDIWWFIAGYSTFFLVILNDVLSDHHIINTVLLIPFGLLLFIFIQAFILSHRFSRAFIRIEKLTHAYERFVPAKFLAKLGKEDIVNVQLGDHAKQNMSVLFADIRAFTSMSEGMTAQETFSFINAYLSRMEPAINQHNGFIDKYVGDEIMALFGEQADDAVNAAIAMLHILRNYNIHRDKHDYAPVHIGIGINTGEVMLGTIGGRSRMEGTVISDTVNLASRIEQLSKVYYASLIISEHTRQSLTDAGQYNIRLLDSVRVKGKTERVAIYEVFDADPPKLRAAKVATCKRFEQAVNYYRLKRYQQALVLFRRCLQQAPTDTSAQVYLQWTQQKLSPPGV